MDHRHNGGHHGGHGHHTSLNWTNRGPSHDHHHGPPHHDMHHNHHHHGPPHHDRHHNHHGHRYVRCCFCTIL
ncbi:unnamed protein product [Tenebrio molitor]|nr:unnamed protein product [Tenebrio molitor]